MKQSSLTTKTSLVQLRKLSRKSKQKTDRTQLDPFLALLYYSMNTTAAKCGLVGTGDQTRSLADDLVLAFSAKIASDLFIGKQSNTFSAHPLHEPVYETLFTLDLL